MEIVATIKYRKNEVNYTMKETDIITPALAPVPEAIGPDEIGKAYKTLRQTYGIAQHAAAELAGTDQAQISRFEHSKCGDLRVSTLSKYLGALGLQLAIIKDDTVKSISDSKGVGVGVETGTINAGILPPLGCKAVEIKYEDTYTDPDIHFETLEGEDVIVMVLAHTETGIIINITNLNKIPQRAVVKWTVEEKIINEED